MKVSGFQNGGGRRFEVGGEGGELGRMESWSVGGWEKTNEWCAAVLPRNDGKVKLMRDNEEMDNSELQKESIFLKTC